ncbi:MAG: GNAT family N-acetyltransferase [Rhizobiaceae bacterium]|nr:GNAT family N-acetyltransferase [Rhizobiaceae bacterium]
MSAQPLVDEMLSSPSAAPAIGLVDQCPAADDPESSIEIGTELGVRRFSLYAPTAAFALVEELDFLTQRLIDQNVFFAPQFLIPAMPRLDERQVRLMVVRDEGLRRSRLRFLMPYSTERAGLFGGPQVIRAWTHPFGPLGTPLVDADDPQETLESLLATIGKPALGLPDVLVLPDLRIDEPFAQTILAAAKALGLPLACVNGFDRAAFDKGNAETAASGLSAKRRRELQRQRRMLEAKGPVSFEIARNPVAVRHAMEEFLVLEASGWKGRARSALVMDRYRAAFARESVNGLAEKDRTRIFTLKVGGQPVASLVAFVLGGEAFAWKMAYDETHAAASPGLQMMLLATDALMADRTVLRADSCAVPDHFLMNRLWKGRIRVETLVVGLEKTAAGRVGRAAKGLEQVHAARNTARLVRARVKRLLRLD